MLQGVITAFPNIIKKMQRFSGLYKKFAASDNSEPVHTVVSRT